MIKPKRKHVICEPLFDPKEYRHGSLVLEKPQQYIERCDQGLVKYVGEDTSEVIDVKPGDLVLFSGYTGTLIELENEGIFIVMPAEFIECVVYPPATDIPGLYFKDIDGIYFTATYEQAMHLMSIAIRESKWHQCFDVKGRMPKVEDYDTRN